MKKHLLLSALLCSAMAISAATPGKGQLPGRSDISSITIDAATVAQIKGNKSPNKAADKSLDYTLADGVYTALGFNNAKAGDKVSMAFEMTPEVTDIFAGNSITAINFYQGTRYSQFGSQRNYVTEADVFLTYDLQEEPFTTAKAKMTTTAFGEVNVELAEPYAIEAGKSVYVGVTSVLKNAKDYTMVVDGMAHNGDEGGWIAANGEWDNISDYYGYCCLSATITGQNIPGSLAAITELSTLPYLTANETFNLDAYIRNQGGESLNSIELTLTIGDEEPIVKTLSADDLGLEPDFGYGRTFGLTLNASYPKSGNTEVPISLKITKVNGEVNKDPGAEATTSAIFIDPKYAFNRTVVIEEFTGIWCGWCPRGIVAMEYVRENYSTDRVIGIAAHYDDAMQTQEYMSVIQNYATSFPSAVFNRRSEASIDYLEYFIEEIDSECEIPAIGKVAVTATLSADTTAIKFNTSSMFSFDYSNANFALEFVLTQDNVGPYTQTNYYAGGDYGEMGGWEKKGSSVRTIYNDVARSLDTYGGVAGSIPASITAGTPYEFSHEIAVPRVVKEYDNLNGIVLIVDKSTGYIVNAAQAKVQFDPAGVNEINVDSSEAPVEYYNLQGVRVANPESGLFIRRQGSRVEKVVL